MATSKTPSPKKTTSKTSTPTSVSTPPVGKPRNNELARTKEELYFNRVGCLCSKCGISLFGPSTEDKMTYTSNGIIKKLSSSECMIPLCRNKCNNSILVDLMLDSGLKLEAERKATLKLGVSPNDHTTDLGIIIILVRKCKAKIKRLDMDVESLLKELQFINPLDLHYLMPNVANETALLYYEIVCKYKNEDVQLQIIEKISQQLVSMKCQADPEAITRDFILNLCKILTEVASSIFESKILKLFLKSVTPMIIEEKDYIMPKINDVPDKNPFISYINYEILLYLEDTLNND